MSEILEERVPTQGYETHLFRAGAGNPHPTLLLHGGGPGAQAWSNWNTTLETLGVEIDVIAPDMAGFGTTTHPDPPPHGPQAWTALRVAQLVAVLDHYGIGRVDVVGNSLGGVTALNLAVAAPERVGKLVLMGSAGPPITPPPALVKMLTFYEDPTAESLRSLLEDFVYDLSRFGNVGSLVQERLALALMPEAQRSWRAMFTTADGEPVRELSLPPERVRAIEHETLIVHGREDRIIPLDASYWLLDHLPNADLHVFGHCGHWAMLERNHEFCGLVLDFVQAAAREVHA